MAWLEQHPTSGRFKICFRWGGQQFKKTVKTTKRSEAEAILLRVEENIGLVERGRLQVPPEADIATFLLSDGKMSQPPKVEPPPKPLAVGELRDLYVAAHSYGVMEANSLQTVKMHLNHFLATFGAQFPITKLTLEDLQRHIERRARKKYLAAAPSAPSRCARKWPASEPAGTGASSPANSRRRSPITA